MKIPTSIAGNKGFTLIELLIVLLIIGVVITFATLSINTARPSATQTLFKQLQNQLQQSQQLAQLKNINLRLVIKGNQSELEQLNPATQQWIKNTEIPTLKWQDIEVQSDESVINIFPNGYTTSTSLSVTLGNESYQLNTK
jgi:type II secretion system protein H